MILAKITLFYLKLVTTLKDLHKTTAITFLYVFITDFDEAASVFSGLLMHKSESVQELVDDGRSGEAATFQ